MATSRGSWRRQAGPRRAPAVGPVRDRPPRSTPVKSATDIGAALRLATALFPDDTQKRIVLLSDGNDTTGGGQAEAALAASQGVRSRPAGSVSARRRVLIERLTTPSTANLGDWSRHRRDPLERRRRHRPPVRRRDPRRPEAGRPRCGLDDDDLRCQADRTRFPHASLRWSKRARHVQPERSRRLGHHRQGLAATLVLAGDDKVAAELVAALKTRARRSTPLVPEALPTDFASLASYDSVVLVDVPDPARRPPARRPPGLRPRLGKAWSWSAGRRAMGRAVTRRRCSWSRCPSTLA